MVSRAYVVGKSFCLPSTILLTFTQLFQDETHQLFLSTHFFHFIQLCYVLGSFINLLPDFFTCFAISALVVHWRLPQSSTFLLHLPNHLSFANPLEATPVIYILLLTTLPYQLTSFLEGTSVIYILLHLLHYPNLLAPWRLPQSSTSSSTCLDISLPLHA